MFKDFCTRSGSSAGQEMLRAETANVSRGLDVCGVLISFSVTSCTNNDCYANPFVVIFTEKWQNSETQWLVYRNRELAKS